MKLLTFNKYWLYAPLIVIAGLVWFLFFRSTPTKRTNEDSATAFRDIAKALIITATHSDEEAAKWVATLPVSMNGEIPKTHYPTWVNNHWHDYFWAQPNVCTLVQVDWKPENFFKDQLVIELCEAIFARDIPKMERLIAAGANVNAIGEDGMNPLYWAFHVEDDPRPFGLLLKHGADPNVPTYLAHRKEVRAVAFTGAAVVHLVSTGIYNRHFQNVFESGGDPNLKWSVEIYRTSTSAFQMISAEAPDAVERLELLVKKGARLNDRLLDGGTLLRSLVDTKRRSGTENAYRLALAVLEAGADFRLVYDRDYSRTDPDPRFEGCHFRAIHYLAEAESMVNERPADEQKQYRALVAWLEEHGESLMEAHVDLARWLEWKETGQSKLIEQEYRTRLAQEDDANTPPNGQLDANKNRESVK